MTLSLVAEAALSGLLLGCFYAAVSMGLAVAFGLVDVPHIAHPTFVVVGAYGTYILGGFGMDPLIAGLVLMPLFFLVGTFVYQFYHLTFEKHGSEAGVRGLAFFFGLTFVIEAMLILKFGVDQHMADASYVGESLQLGDTRIPYRMLIALAIGVMLTVVLGLYLRLTFTGRALKAVAQDEGALLLVGANPIRIRRLGFGIATAIAALAGALLIIVGPVEPGTGRLYIGRAFAIVVLAGLGSIPGTLAAALIVGVTEMLVLSSVGASWASAVSFGILLLVLGLRPSGLFGR